MPPPPAGLWKNCFPRNTFSLDNRVGDPWTTWKNLEDIMPSEMSDTKGQILYDATSIRYLEQEIHRQKVELKLPGVGMRVYYFMGTEILLGR